MVYDELTRALAAVGSDIDGAECHGILCGLIATSDDVPAQRWLEHSAGRSDLAPFGPPGTGHIVWSVLADTERAFQGGDCALELVLPEDDAPAAERADALVAWARGFLSGFGLAGAETYGSLDEDERAFIHDLTSVARLDTAVPEDDEDAETLLMEIAEFMKLGAIMLYESRGTGVTDAPSPVLH